MAFPAKKDIMERAPCGKPPFTLSELRKAIPPHCFKRSLLTSFSYLGYDLLVAALLLYSTTSYYFTSPGMLGWALWFGYWAAQGCVLTGIWVIAHECGHHAFSDYSLVDDTVGLILHSWLVVPYFSWKYSHRRHHSNTGNLERDEVFVPRPKNDILKLTSNLLSNPPGRLLRIAITLTLGWPLYLTFNVSGRKYPRFACHFDPYSPIYTKRERFQILVSDIALVGVAYTLYLLASAYGFSWVIKVYGIPLMIVNAYLVLITYLQHTHPALPHYDGSEWEWVRGALHTHPALPHYDGSEWEWVRGALSTVDRDYGMLNYVFHHITDTHVTHHLFSTIPHYHAVEATRTIKPILGNYYCYDNTPVCNALWREFRECEYVEADSPGKSGIVLYRSKFI